MRRGIAVAVLMVVITLSAGACGGGSGAVAKAPSAVVKSVNACLTAHGATTVKVTDDGIGGLATFAGDTPSWNDDGGYASYSFAVQNDANGKPISVVGVAFQHVGTAAGAAMKACAPRVSA